VCGGDFEDELAISRNKELGVLIINARTGCLERLSSALSFLVSGEEMSDGGVSRFVTSSDVSHFRYHVVYRPVSISNKNFGDITAN